MDIGETLFNVFFKPKLAFRNISINRPAAAAGFIVLITTYISTLVILLPGPFFQRDIIATLIFGFSAALLRLIGVLIVSLFLYLAATLLQGEGSFMGLFSSLGFAHFLLILLPLPEFIGEIWGGQFLSIWLRSIIIIWFVFLAVIAIRESQSFTTSKALLTVGLTGIGIIALKVFVFLSFLALFLV